jgi:hypothetical protein
MARADVRVDVPAAPRSLRLLRLAAADAAAEMGLDVDGVESARIAVDELASVLLASGTWERLSVCFERLDDGLHVTGGVQGDASGRTGVRTDRIVEELLAVCVADYSVTDGDAPSFWFRLEPPA